MGDRRILVADPDTTTRAAIASLLVSMGVRTQWIALAPSFEVARELIERLDPVLTITEYDFPNGHCGLELLKHREAGTLDALLAPTLETSGSRSTSSKERGFYSRDSIFMILTKNASSLAVAQAAEENVDLYGLKPFLAKEIESRLLKVVERKLQPPVVIKFLEQGHQAKKAGDLLQALQHFLGAREMAKAEARCEFLIRQALPGFITTDSRASSTSAVGSTPTSNGAKANGTKANGTNVEKIFSERSDAISACRVQYKCLVESYEILLSQGRIAEAYRLIRQSTLEFALHPKRLSEVISLAVKTGNFDDILHFHDLYLELPERGEGVTKHICSGLLVAGKYSLLKKDDPQKGLLLFDKAIASSGCEVWVLRDVITTLVQAQLPGRASEILRRFKVKDRTTVDYLAMDYLLFDQFRASAQSIARGWKLISDEVADPLIYQILMKRLVERGQMDPAEHLGAQATRLWPDQAERFRAITARAPGLREGSQKA